MDTTTKTDTNPAAVAAIVFRDVLTREIGEENERLKDGTCFKSLLDHIQKVELVAVTNEEPAQLVRVPLNNNGHGSDSIGTPPDDDEPKPAKYETISTAYLSQGTVMVFDQGCHVESESLTIPVESSQNILLHNVGIGMKVNVAGKSICSFPHEFFGTGKSTVVEITDDNTAHLTVHISESVHVKGTLETLSDDEIAAFKEMPDDTGHHMILSKYLMPLLQVNTHDGPHPTFRPTSIVILLSPMMRDVLHLVERATAPSNADWALEGLLPSDQLRYSTMSALGNESHINMLNENLTLKLHQELRKMVTSVNISHIDGTMKFSLEEGSMFDSQWRIYVAEKDHSSMPVNCIKDSIFYMSGTQLGNSDRKWTPQLISREGYQLVLSISNRFGVHMLGTFNWDDLPYVPDIVGGTETFQQRVYSSVSGLYVGNEPFPDMFRLQIKEVVFSQQSIEDALVLVGLGRELVSSDAGAKSDHYWS